MRSFSVEEITQIVGGMLTKAECPTITQIAPPLLSDENTLALALSEEEIANLAKSKAKAALVPFGVNISGLTTIEVERPRLAMMKLITLFYEEPAVLTGGTNIHPTAVVHETAKIGQNVQIGPHVIVSKNAEIGDGTKLLGNTYIGNNAKIGKNCFFHTSVNIGDRVKIGDKVILHNGVSLGADGFSFVTENPNNIEQARKEGGIKEQNTEQVIFKIPSIGSVVIGNNVEIGANTCIDRARFDKTLVSQGTKIDNLVQIGHNVEIGQCALLVSQVGISGSTKIGNGCVLGGQVGVAGHLKIGDGAMLGGQSGVNGDIPPKSYMRGTPPRPYMRAHKLEILLDHLHELYDRVKELEALQGIQKKTITKNERKS